MIILPQLKTLSINSNLQSQDILAKPSQENGHQTLNAEYRGASGPVTLIGSSLKDGGGAATAGPMSGPSSLSLQDVKKVLHENGRSNVYNLPENQQKPRNQLLPSIKRRKENEIAMSIKEMPAHHYAQDH